MTVILNPYLTFRDTARAAMEHYQSVFGGDLVINTYADMPAMETEAAEADKVMHSMLTGENGLVLMAGDLPNGTEFTPFNGSISLSGDDDAVLRGFFEKLSAGGEITMPLEIAPWGDAFGQLTDKFGINWMVNIVASQS